MSFELEAAIHAARAAGELLCQRFGAAREIRYKGPTDPVTEMDHQAQDLVARMLGEAFPAYSLLGEEGGGGCAPDGPCWLVDPLDGTTNYIRGYPLFAVSIALERGDDIVVGVVYNPVLNELFAAEKGQGATLNGRPIHVSTTSSLEASVLASGFPYDPGAAENNNSRHWGRFLKRTLSLRCDGSAALDLCHVAMGRLDGFWELDLGPWDMAAGVLIVREAGGYVTHVTGGRFSPYERGILASNNHLHAEMLTVLTGD